MIYNLQFIIYITVALLFTVEYLNKKINIKT